MSRILCPLRNIVQLHFCKPALLLSLLLQCRALSPIRFASERHFFDQLLTNHLLLAQSSHPLYRQFTMAAIDKLVLRDVTAQLVKRKNWAAQEPGVITVFAIVGAGTCCPYSPFPLVPK